MNFPINKKTLVSGFALLVILAGFYGASLFSDLTKDRLELYSEEVIRACSEVSYVSSCYDEEIPKLMDKYGVTLEDSFKVTQLVQDKDPRYLYCHVLGHNLSAKEAAKDLSKWTDVIARCPLGQCSNGCLHGAFQERFRDENLSHTELESLIPKLTEVCRDGPGRTFTELERGSCFHALGHLTMYVTKADPEQSVTLCNRVMPSESYEKRHLCYDGVFMQIFQPLEPEDFALVKDIAPETKEGAIKLCDKFSGAEHDSCLQESWPMFFDEIKTPNGLTTFCGMFGNESSINTCFYSLFFLLPVEFNFNKTRIVSFCDQVDNKYKGKCFAKAASRNIESDKKLIPQAVEYCKLADNREVGEDCWREMLFYSRFALKRDTESFNQLCELLPDDWKEQCFDPTIENVIIYE